MKTGAFGDFIRPEILLRGNQEWSLPHIRSARSKSEGSIFTVSLTIDDAFHVERSGTPNAPNLVVFLVCSWIAIAAVAGGRSM
jgi:hypothetical protein